MQYFTFITQSVDRETLTCIFLTFEDTQHNLISMNYYLFIVYINKNCKIKIWYINAGFLCINCFEFIPNLPLNHKVNRKVYHISLLMLCQRSMFEVALAKKLKCLAGQGIELRTTVFKSSTTELFMPISMIHLYNQNYLIMIGINTCKPWKTDVTMIWFY